MEDSENQNHIAREFKKALYKLENQDFTEAERILEDLALAYDVPMAWAYIGAIKFGQLNTGGATVQQALNCFSRATGLNPSGKSEYQEAYIKLSLGQLEALKEDWYETKKHGKKAARSRLWNAAALGVAVGLGNQKTKTGNNIFRGTAGVAGAAYTLNRIQKHSQETKSAKEGLAIIEETMRQVLRGVREFCSDNILLYGPFLEKANNFGFSDKVLSVLK